ncbi:MAG: serine hydrolase [Deltaproteobacteria bacterium]|nr:serine hydrolase [Deltaproteobacteria bacterium]
MTRSPIDLFAIGARDGAYPGGQLAASREGIRLVNAAVGLLSPGGGPTQEDALYDLASLTKPLSTALLTGRAVEAGLCRFEDPLSKLIPVVDPKITVEQVLDHSTGWPAHRRFDQLLPAHLTPGTWDAWCHIVFDAVKTPREVEPGTRAEYSDVGFIVLGAALEALLARPLSLAFGLLGTALQYRDFRGPPAFPPVRPKEPIAPTEDCVPGQVHDENARAMGGVAGHAGLFGHAEGVLKVCEQLIAAYHGVRGGLLSPETVRRLWQPSLVPGSTRTLGWDRPSAEGSSTGGRWPAHSVGHLGFTGTSVWIEPDRALCVVLVTNRVCPTRANNTIRRLRPMLYDAAWEHWSSAKPTSRRAKPRSSAVIVRAEEEEDPDPTVEEAIYSPGREKAPPSSS